MIRGAFLLVGLLLGLLLSAVGSARAGVDVPAVTDRLLTTGDSAVAAYDPAAGLDTADAFSALYFDVFEASGLEKAVGMRDAARKTRLEYEFGAVIGLASQGAPAAEVRGAWETLRADLKATGARMTADSEAGGSAWAAGVQSFLILLREGVEAILVVTALVAYMARSGQGDKVRVVWHGVGWALGFSLLTAWLMAAVFEVSGAWRPRGLTAEAANG